MSFGDFVETFSQLLQDLTNIGLTNWSEPFLNKDIITIIEHMKATRSDIIIWVSSNRNAFRHDLTSRTVLAGLDYLEIAISGLIDMYHRLINKIKVQ